MTALSKRSLPNQGWRQHFEIAQELGGCYAQLGDYQQARACYQKAAILEPDDPEPYIGAGTIALRQGRLDDAEMAFQVALCLAPQNNEATVGCAQIAAQQGKPQQAFDLYRQCLDRDCDQIVALLAFFHVARQLGIADQALGYLTLYLDMHPGEISVMCCLATLYLKNHQFTQAQTLMRDAVILEPDHREARQLLDEIHCCVVVKRTRHPLE